MPDSQNSVPAAAEGSVRKLTIREVALFGMLGGLTFAMKVVMSGLPNIEPVSLMVMLFAVTFGRKAIYPIYIYVLLEFSFYGLALWCIPYLYIWGILAGAAYLCRHMEGRLLWGILSGTFGLLFGTLCTPVCFFTGGLGYAFSWWISGLPYDLLHCAGNFAIAFALFPTLRTAMGRAWRQFETGSIPGNE